MAVGLGRAVPSVLVVEDDATVRRFLAENLIADRFAPMSAASAEEAMALLAGARPDAALIDVGLPGMSGLDLIGDDPRRAAPTRPWDSGLPILLLSGEASPHAAVRGIERGADDFVAKPFHYPEVLARLGALIRRARGAVVAEEVRVGALTIDRHGHVATLGGRRLDLSAKEFALLDALARDPNRVRHQDRAAARRVGLPLRGAHPHGRQPRQPAAPQARRARRRRAVGREHLGHRLPAAAGGGLRWAPPHWTGPSTTSTARSPSSAACASGSSAATGAPSGGAPSR